MRMTSPRYLLFLSEHAATLYSSSGIVWSTPIETTTGTLTAKSAAPAMAENSSITIVLSNAFYNLFLVPWAKDMHNLEDIHTYAISSIIANTGKPPQISHIRTAIQRYGNPFLAAQTEAYSADNIMQLAMSLFPKCKIESLQPLVTFLHKAQEKFSGLLAVCEGGKIFSLFVEKGIITDIEIDTGNDRSTAHHLTTRQLLRLGKEKTTVILFESHPGHEELTQHWYPSSIKDSLTLSIQQAPTDERNRIEYHPSSRPSLLSRTIFTLLVLMIIIVVPAVSYLAWHANKQKNTLVWLSKNLDQIQTETNTQSLAQKTKKLNNLYSSLAEPKQIPWDDIFTALENLDYKNIALLSINTRWREQILELSGEARNLNAVNNYLESIETSPSFYETQLISHLKVLNEPHTPSRFVFTTRWKNAAAE